MTRMRTDRFVPEKRSYQHYQVFVFVVAWVSGVVLGCGYGVVGRESFLGVLRSDVDAVSVSRLDANARLGSRAVLEQSPPITIAREACRDDSRLPIAPSVRSL